jgi:hypothetical protein
VTPTIDDELWAAIGDQTRRRLLDLLLAAGSGTATSLSGHLPVTRQPVASTWAPWSAPNWSCPRKDGREVRYVVNEAQFSRAVEQLASVGAACDARLRRIKTIAESIRALRSKTKSKTE